MQYQNFQNSHHIIRSLASTPTQIQLTFQFFDSSGFLFWKWSFIRKPRPSQSRERWLFWFFYTTRWRQWTKTSYIKSPSHPFLPSFNSWATYTLKDLRGFYFSLRLYFTNSALFLTVWLYILTLISHEVSDFRNATWEKLFCLAELSICHKVSCKQTRSAFTTMLCGNRSRGIQASASFNASGWLLDDLNTPNVTTPTRN